MLEAAFFPSVIFQFKTVMLKLMFSSIIGKIFSPVGEKGSWGGNFDWEKDGKREGGISRLTFHHSMYLSLGYFGLNKIWNLA